MDQLLLQVLKHKDQYELLHPIIPESALEEPTRRLIRAFGNWFEQTECELIDIEAFKSYFFNFHNKDSDEKKRYYSKMLNQVKEEPDPKAQATIAHRLIELGLCTKVANLAREWDNGAELNIVEELRLAVEDANARMVNESADYHVVDNIEEIVTHDEREDGLRFALPCLQQYLRPLQSGDFVIAAGRPDTGKTSFLASQLYSLYDGVQDRRPIVWFNNEGTGDRIVKRIYQAVLGDTTDDLIGRNHRGTLRSDFQAAFGGHNPIKVIDCHGWGISEVERAINYYNPGLVLFDMIDNIRFPYARSDTRTDQVLESMYQWARTLGVRYDFPVIATSQVSAGAEETAETRCFPTQEMLKDSKTGKQGAADLIIMIGRSNEPGTEHYRYISTPKNKLAKTVVNMREQVWFDPQRAIYK